MHVGIPRHRLRPDGAADGAKVSVIVCAHNEAAHLPACLHSLLAQTRLPDEILVVNNASTDATRAVAEQVPGVRVVDEPRKGLVVARETGRHETTGDILVYLDADCRAPLMWIERIARRFDRDAGLIALSARYASTTGTGGADVDSRLRLRRRSAHAAAGQARAGIGTIFLRRKLRRSPRRAGSHRRVRYLDRIPR
jgi:glycosyltransferase involved in cell wall biosynthesis